MVSLGTNASCETKSKPVHEHGAGSAQPAIRADAPVRSKISALLRRDDTRERDEPPEIATSSAARRAPQAFVLDDLVDVAPAAPAAAAPDGVILITRSDKVTVAQLGGSSKSPGPTATPVSPVDADPKDFIARGRGPAVVRRAAYWISGTRLVRQSIDGGALEVLATDARAYTQVAGLPGADESAATAVAYIAVHPRDPGALVARLWVQGAEIQTLSPEGTTANSVTLVRRRQDWLALFLESRTGMSPLHARPIDITGHGPKLGADFIAWVAGSAQPMSVVRAIGDAEQTWAFLPIERDISRFGLARVTVADANQSEPEVAWRDYPNGTDPAPVSAAWVCDRPMVLYSRPSSAAPRAPQELHLATVSASGLGPSTLIGSSRAYSDVSLAQVTGGALIVFVADHRTRARRLRSSH